jgi:hypothetical protein
VSLFMTHKPQLFLKNILGAEGVDYGKHFDEHYQQQKMHCERTRITNTLQRFEKLGKIVKADADGLSSTIMAESRNVR